MGIHSLMEWQWFIALVFIYFVGVGHGKLFYREFKRNRMNKLNVLGKKKYHTDAEIEEICGFK